MTDSTIENLLHEERRFAPPNSFKSQANLNDPRIYERGKDPEKFWAEQAENFEWFEKWNQVLDWNPPWAKWFVGGKLNITVNCLDRHLKTWRRNKAAFIWEGEPGDQRVLTYGDLHREVCRLANGLKNLGVQKGDRVTIYLGMIPELPIAMLACARIGAAHSVVFGGFSPDSLRERINDSQSKVVITADGGWRGGKIIPLKHNVDEALPGCPSVKSVVVVRRIGHAGPGKIKEGRDFWWHDLIDEVSSKCEPEVMDSEDLLYILYTSGTTGKPKGIAHTTAGYLVGTAMSHKWIFDIKDEDVYWCTADIGWVTGHSYIVYGPLANGTTGVMYEGAPAYPEKDRFWEMIEKYSVSIFYTAPTAIRTFMRWGSEHIEKHDLSSLRLLGSVGEPINPEAWIWYHENIGKGSCPIVDTWWQTETGMILISPLPGITTTKPGSATFPLPGIEPDVVDESGKSVPLGSGGYLVLRAPWPSMLRTIYGDPERYREVYWSKFPGLYFTGDGCKRDEDGYYWLLGRVDDIMLVAGHNISTTEVESALVDHHDVAEAAVVGKTHDVKGQAIDAFVTLKLSIKATEALRQELREHVAKKIGALARPDEIYFTAELPKTRSGKIMRRLLRDIAEGQTLGDVSTLADPSVIESLKAQYEEGGA
ncbi:acetate--CoA ligase [Candidatus Acetothermia bacterium]|nr:acetate--CoA ligase [Candidatus Acetothermia bacterium]MBI3643446.1 acetate--CoA ligase [Candidatus Acetothermia bacterium]